MQHLQGMLNGQAATGQTAVWLTDEDSATTADMIRAQAGVSVSSNGGSNLTTPKGRLQQLAKSSPSAYLVRGEACSPPSLSGNRLSRIFAHTWGVP